MKKSVIKHISLCALSLVTGFFYSLKNVYADEYHFIDDFYLYQQFYRLGFKDPEREISYNVDLSDHITGTLNQDGSLNLNFSNFKATTDGNDKFYIGGSAGSGYGQQIRGDWGSTSQSLVCVPTTTGTSQNTTYTCNIKAGNTNYGTHESLNINTINISGYYDNNSTTTFTGSIGSNGSIKFNVDENGSITGTVSTNLVSSFDYLLNDNPGETLEYYFSEESQTAQSYVDKDTYFVIVANIQGTFTGSYSSDTHPATLFKTSRNNSYFGSMDFKATNNNNINYSTINNQYINSICVWYNTSIPSNQNNQNKYFKKNPNFVFPSDFKIVPIYIGYLYYMPDDLRVKLGFGTRENTILISGNNSSKASERSSESANNNLTSGFNQLDTFEQGFNNDLTAGFQAIDTNTNITTDGNFINSALWISQQFTRIVSYPAINLSLVFCLILGLAMTLIGKLRG